MAKPALEDWDDYTHTIDAANLDEWRKKWQRKDADAMRIKLAEIGASLSGVDEKLAQLHEREAADASGHDPLGFTATEEQRSAKLQRKKEALRAQQAFLEERVALEPACGRPALDDDHGGASPPPLAAPVLDVPASAMPPRASKPNASRMCTLS